MIIGVEGLSAAEVSLLRTILKLSTQLAVDWSLSEKGPCDVLLTANTAAPGLAPAGARAQVVVPIVRRGENQGSECLERPFRAEDFVALLGRVGPVVKVDASHERQSDVPAPPAVRRGRLKRWPPAQLMGTSRERIQLATLLSRRSRSAHELSAMAGYPESACGAFMQELDRHNLLNWEIHEHPLPAAPVIHAPASASQGLAAPGLLSSIRRRLGLSWNSRSAE
ncbi:hypothetical protein [Polaromonas sp.]|uniref:hypothetical protein n=1 Tax=Polaromonas sp. TaxID=1869339 RepID=UPI003262E13E